MERRVSSNGDLAPVEKEKYRGGEGMYNLVH